MLAHALIHWISDLLWPLSCLGCGKGNTRLCFDCLGNVESSAVTRYQPFPYIDRLLAPGTMRADVLARAIWHLKYRNTPALAETLGDWLAAAARTARLLPSTDTIAIPVPLHASRLRERGYNQAHLLANQLARATHLLIQPNALVRVRRTHSQVNSSGRTERLANMVGAFTCTDPAQVRGRTIFLVDDVCTTGATLSACAHTLKAAGARTVIGVVLAH